MDKIKLLENLLIVRLLSGDMTDFMTELLQLNITPSEAKTMDPFGDPEIGAMVAKIIEDNGDAANQEALATLRDYVSKLDTVSTKTEPEAAPVKATESVEHGEVAKELENQMTSAEVPESEMEVEPTTPIESGDELKALFSAVQDMIKEGFASINAKIDEMESALKEAKIEEIEEEPVAEEVETANFSSDDEVTDAEDTEVTSKEFEILKEMIMSIMPEDKKAEWESKICPECGKSPCECGGAPAEAPANFDEETEAPVEDIKTEDEVEEVEEAPVEKPNDELKEALAEVLAAAKELKEALAEEGPVEDTETEEVEEVEDVDEEPKKGEGLTEDEIKAIESESANFSTMGRKISVMDYLYGDNY